MYYVMYYQISFSPTTVLNEHYSYFAQNPVIEYDI